MEVEDRNWMFLANSVDSTDALLDLHRIPREVVIHDDVTELEVASFSAGLGADEYLRPLASSEAFHGCVLLGGRLLPVEHLDLGEVGELSRQHVLRFAEFREDEHLRIRG